MKQTQRVLIEIFMPPLLAAIIIVVGGYTSDSLTDIILGFPAFLGFSYVFGIIPSLLYAFMMEIWFRKKLHEKLGISATVLFSLLLGSLAGLSVFILSKTFTQGSASDMRKFIGIGSLTGIISGLGLACCLKRQENRTTQERDHRSI